MGKAERRKGAEGERQFVAMLSQHDPAASRLQRKLTSARDGGDDLRYLGLSVEVKRHRRLALTSWYRQVLAQDSDVLAFRLDRGPWEILVRMDFEEFAQYALWRARRG